MRWTGALLTVTTGLGATPAPPSVPYFASLSRDKAYLREGPTYQHPILWVYHRKDLPVAVVQSYDVWRKIRDSDGTTGWIHSSMLSDRRTVVVTSKTPARIRAGDSPAARVVALAQPGVVAKLEACEAQVCEVSANGTDGWMEKQDIWGVGVGEVFR